MRPSVMPVMRGRRDKSAHHAHRRTMHGRDASASHRQLVIEQNVTNENGPSGHASGSSNRPRADPCRPAIVWFAGGQGCL